MHDRPPTCEEAYVDTPGGRMHYLHAGTGRPILLLHGLVGSSSNWRQTVVALAQDANVYAIDQINMGKSERVPDVDPGLGATSDRIAAAMEALGLDRADIAGHSHGGSIALMLAARHPERVRSLILFAPANPFCALPDPVVRFYSTVPGMLLARAAPYVPRPIQLMALGKMYGDPARIGEGCMKGYIDGLRMPGTISHILSIVRCWFADMTRLKAALPLVADVPTLLLWGDRDLAMSTESGRQLQQVLTRAELIVTPTGGHVLFEEIPEESHRLMLSWLRRDLDSEPLNAFAGTPVVQREEISQADSAEVSISPVAMQHLSTGV